MKNWEKHANIFELAQGRRLWKLGRVAELERTDSGSIRSLVLDDRRCYVELDPEFFDLPLQPPEEDARAERERTARSLTDFSHSLDSILSACLPCDEGAAPGLDFVRSALAGVSSPAEDLARSRMADVISQSLVDSFLSSLDAGGDRKREEKEDEDGDGIPLGEIWGLYDMGKTSCTCFAEREEAQSAGLCPHIAATLYALDAGMKITEDHVIDFDAPEPAWEDMISSMKRSELRDLLLRLGRQEPRVRETVLFQRNPRATPFQLERWRMRMRKLVLDCCGTDASLSLTQSTDLYVAVDAFLTEILDPLSRQGLWMDCFEVVCMASREIAALQEKNIMGGLVSLTDRFIQLFRELLSLVTPEERQQMYGWFLDCYHNFQRDPAVFLVLFAPVWEKAELETSLDLLDRDLEECEKLDSAADPCSTPP